MRKQQNFQFNGLEYLEEAMTLYGIYSANSMDEKVDAINHLNRNLSKHKNILSCRQSYYITTKNWNM